MRLLVRMGLLILIPGVELTLLIYVGQYLGFWLTFSWIFVSATCGIFLVKNQGISIVERGMDCLSRGQWPTNQMIEGGLLLIAGFSLLVPGVITDFVGFLLLSPRVRIIVEEFCMQWTKQAVSDHLHRSSQFDKSDVGSGCVIDGEFERKDSDSNDMIERK